MGLVGFGPVVLVMKTRTQKVNEDRNPIGIRCLDPLTYDKLT